MAIRTFSPDGWRARTNAVNALVAMVNGLMPAGPPGRPVRHQGILLLWAAGRAKRGLPRLVRWSEAKEQLRPLFIDLGREGSRPTPEYPFVALARTPLWQISDAPGDVPAAHGSAPLAWLAENNPLGGLPEPVYKRLAVDPVARAGVVRALLDRFFHDGLAAEACRLTGLEPPSLPTAPVVLRELEGHTVRTATGRPNTVGAIVGDAVSVGTERSPSGQLVPVAEVQHGIDMLAVHGSVRVHPQELGHRSAFVGAVLATLPGARFAGSPVAVTLDDPDATDVPVELAVALDDADRAAGRPRPSRAQGFGLTQPERDEIERHSMAVAAQHLTHGGYAIEDVSATCSYDFAATRFEELVYVEVKGTTSAGEEILLTHKEVQLMTDKYPSTMLIVVRDIALDRSADRPHATGGSVKIEHPWRIQPDNLTPISYRYRIGPDDGDDTPPSVDGD